MKTQKDIEKETEKKINVEYIKMTNEELTKEFVKDDIEGGIGAGWDMSKFKIIKGETYKLKGDKK